MSPARRRAPRQSSSGQPHLLVPRAQLDSELGERITLGEQLLGRTLRDKVELRAARQEYYSWTEYNEVLIKRMSRVSWDLGSGPMIIRRR